jgi:hypothetical protein
MPTENTTTKASAAPEKTAQIDETEEARRGALIREVLQLRRSIEYRDRVNTAWGNKTDLGLFRTMKRIIEDGE